jgi:hypothetical protein
MPIDPIFGIPSEIYPGCNVVNPRDQGGVAESRPEAISRAAYRVRDILFRNYETVVGEPADMLPAGDQTDLLMAAFCNRASTLSHYLTPELESALADFRHLVPLLPMNAIDRLASEAPSVQIGAAQNLFRQYEEGGLSEADYLAQSRKLALEAGLPFPNDAAGPESITAALEASLVILHQQGSKLSEIAEGSESRVYLNEPSMSVYKAVPFRGELLQIPPSLGDENVVATNDHGTFLADQYGGMPLFDRARLLASVGGMCKTELVGMTAGGVAIYKQPFLGEKEPNEEQVVEWVKQFGHAALAQQNEGDEPSHDIDRLPFVAEGPDRDSFVVGLDLNPRNSRVWNGWCIPFDPVLRVLAEEEIMSNPRIGLAVESVRMQRRKSLAPTI